MLLLPLVLLAAVGTGRGQGEYGVCLTGHRSPQSSDPFTLDALQDSRLDFSLGLFKQIASVQPSENVFFSPFSVHSTLVLAYFTSAGHTERSLHKFLSLPPNKDKTDLLKAYALHKHKVALGRYKSQVHTANRLFISNRQTIKDCMADIFHDEIETVDFSPKGLAHSVDIINNWVSNHTQNKIQNLVSPDSISPESQIVLANVAYFKGAWITQFDPIDTKMRPFYISKNKTATVPMMFQMSSFKFWRSDRLGAEMLELPYLEPMHPKQTSNISLILMLPDETGSQHPATDLVMRLDSASIREMVRESMDPRNEEKMEVRLPKFSLERTLELTPILESMGVGDLFKPSSDLSGLTGGPRIKLSSAIHKAKVRVDEYGTEAAAATVFTDTRIPGESFNCDRPFVYLLHDKTVQSLLFVGLYNYPDK